MIPGTSPNVGEYLAEQLGLDATPNLPVYFQSRVHWDHQRRIIAQYHYFPFEAQPQHWRLTRWLYIRAWTAAERPSVTAKYKISNNDNNTSSKWPT